MNFYEVQEQWNNLHWHTVAYFKKESDAEKLVSMYESRNLTKPVRILEKKFTNSKELKDKFGYSV